MRITSRGCWRQPMAGAAPASHRLRCPYHAGCRATGLRQAVDGQAGPRLRAAPRSVDPCPGRSHDRGDRRYQPSVGGQHGFDPHRITVVANGVEIDSFGQIVSAPRSRPARLYRDARGLSGHRSDARGVRGRAQVAAEAAAAAADHGELRAILADGASDWAWRGRSRSSRTDSRRCPHAWRRLPWR